MRRDGGHRPRLGRLIVSNPPYVPLAQREGLQREVRDWEPAVALFGGETGFDMYRRIGEGAARVLQTRRMAGNGVGQPSTCIVCHLKLNSATVIVLNDII